jgi:hypothetical protein
MASNGLMGRMMDVGNRLFGKSDEKGALPTIYAATMDVPPGAYVGPDGRFEVQGRPTLVGTSNAARNAQAQRRLWEVSEQLTGIRFLLEDIPQAA